MKKIVLGVVGLLVLLAIVFGALPYAASERVEVVELHTTDAEGNSVTTRLWVVDHEGTAYLRVGADGSGWFDRVTANGTVGITRNDVRATYRTQTRPALSDTVNRLMQTKYTWSDTLIGVLVGSREGSIPIALLPTG